MAGKRERLRQGEVVELEPGLSGRLDFNDRTLHLSNGRKLPISEKDQRDLFPANEEALGYARQREEIQQNIKSTPFGEFFHQLGQTGGIGGIKDLGDRYLSGRTKPEYERLKAAEREIGEEISEESPWTSAGATVAGIVPELYLTRGMSAFKAAPLLTGVAAGSRIFDEPLQVAGEAGLAAGAGKILDLGGAWLSRAAKRRGAIRNLPAQQEAVAAENLAGQQAVNAANREQQQAYNALKERVKNENSALLHQHNLELNARQNRMIEAENAYTKANAAREAEIVRLKNADEATKAARKAELSRLENETKRLQDEYKLAQKQYDQAVKDVPRLQKEAQAEYSKGVVKNAKDIEKSFPKDSKVLLGDFGSNAFIENNITKSGLAGSKEGGQAARIIKSLFPEGEEISARELSKRYKALEDAIQRSTPEVQGVLTSFKNHLGERLPMVLEDSIAFHKVMPLLGKSVEKDIASIFSKMKNVDPAVVETVKSNARQALQGIKGTDFVNRLQKGDIVREVLEKVSSLENFLPPGLVSTDVQKVLAQGPKHQWYQAFQNVTREAERQQQAFLNQLSQKVNNNIARYEIKAMEAGKKASEKIGPKIEGTMGVAPAVPNPKAPISPELPSMEIPSFTPSELPPPIQRPQTPLMPSKPSLNAEPTAPMPQTFSPQPTPTLAPASGTAEHAGQFLEKNLLGGNSLVNNPLTKLAGLKYLLGKAALPIEAAYLGMKGLTSPTAAGEVARMTFKQGGIQAIESWMKKYPSYHDGILENPQERRSITKEIEDDQEIPIEQKALLQSKINRGKPIGASFF